MKRTLIHIFILLLSTTAVLSCSAEIPDAFNPPFDYEESPMSILITGIVTDNDSGEPLEGISIKFKAFPRSGTESPSVVSDRVYTDNRGIFTIQTAAPEYSLSCILIAEDENSVYDSRSKEIIVTWSGPSFDNNTNTFVVNDCNFSLTKKQ